MVAMLDIASMEGVISMSDAIDLLEKTLAHEARGSTSVSPKFVTEFNGGAMRVLFAADSDSGYCAMKAYHNVNGAGARYVVLLYSLKDGELLAVLDGRLITDLRTGAASGVAARKVPLKGPVTLGLVGSGNQARTQLESLAAVYDVASAAVFSPTAANRKAFAAEMSAKLGFPVTPVGSAETAVRGRQVVATASKARDAEPIVRAEWLGDCRLLCAVGNTRPQFAEVDVACFQMAGLVIVDSTHALEEAGELRQAAAADALPETKCATLAEIVAGVKSVPPRGLVVFKSVGMALQDLALAAHYYERLSARPGTVKGPDVASLRERAKATASV
ncbi:MAG: ornithine cyclodeaminase family protein [Betaproteobacteria bacterium]|nr:ornithine cyclodeaminase family protein [Betaproteobacteria bacterium]